MNQIFLSIILLSTTGCVFFDPLTYEDTAVLYERCVESGMKLARIQGYHTPGVTTPEACIPPQYRNRNNLQQYRSIYTDTGEPVIQLGPHHGVTERGKEVYIP
jgi:hypothetical protein